MKKLVTCIALVMCMVIGITGIYAESNKNIIDMEYTDNVYKFSDSADIKLPFIRMCDQRMIIDKDVNKSGIAFSKDGLNVEKNLKGIQILASSDTVRITGNMEYGMILAPTVIIDGTVDKTLLIMSDNITVSKSAVIKEDLLCSANNLYVYGSIQGNVLGVVNNANIDGSIVQDLRVRASNVLLGQNSNIQGNIYISSENNINVGNKYPNAVVNVHKYESKPYTINLWSICFSSIIFGLIYILFSTKTNIFKNTLDKVKTYRLQTVVYGILALILFPLIVIASIFLTIFGFGVITVPFMIIYISFLIVSFILSSFIVGSITSEYIANKYNSKVNTNGYKFILATCIFLVLKLIASIPVVGFTISMIICILSTGILFTAIFKKVNKEENVQEIASKE